jgi:hypothetical protein
MFGLVLLVGPVIDRVGLRRALAGGLVLLAVCTLALAGTLDSVLLTAVVLFGVGLGWNIAYVAAATGLAEGASPVERGKVLGFADLLSGLVWGRPHGRGGLRARRSGDRHRCRGRSAARDALCAGHSRSTLPAGMTPPRGPEGRAISQRLQRPAAVVFDADGVLVDTEPAWVSARRALFERHGLRFGPEEERRTLGTGVGGTAQQLSAFSVSPPERRN